jgi:hypothetical protein
MKYEVRSNVQRNFIIVMQHNNTRMRLEDQLEENKTK